MTKQVFTASQVLTAAQMNTLQNNDFNWDTSTKTTSYVLVAADAGTRVIMNSGSATTITVNTGLFAAGDVLWIHNIGTGTCTITAGTATVNTSGSLALAQWGGGSLYFTSASSAIFFPAGARNTLNVEFLLVGGGGGGGGQVLGTGSGGGGGAGGFVTGSGIIGKTTYNIKVGAGGSGSTTTSQSGTRSSFINAANGGGAGSNVYSGQNGASGGGGRGDGVGSGGTGISGEGNNGGNGAGGGGQGAGGGGGAGGTGSNGSTNTGGAGGAASSNLYTGSSISYSGGGGGGGTTGGTAGTNAGNGGSNAAGSNATANRGGGGGGGGHNNAGGNGGSGRVVVRWLTADATGLSISTTGSPTTGTDGSYTWYAWDSTGTLVVA